MIEQWRAVDDYPAYEVSNLGRVRSADRTVRSWRSEYTVLGRVLKPIVNNHGRQMVNLCDGQRGCIRAVHRMVLTAFVGPCPPGMEACHTDGDRTNNAITNLRWDTKVANEADKVAHGTRAKGTRIASAKLTEEKVREIRKRVRSGETHEEVACAYGVSSGAVGHIMVGRNWAHVQDVA